MRKPTQEQIDRWVRRAAHTSLPHAADAARRLLALHGLGFDGKPDATIARDAAASGARLPRGTARVP